MNPDRDEEIAASVGAHRDLGSAYDDAIAAGLVERIGAEVDRRVDERIAQYQSDALPPAGSDPAASPQAQHPAVHPGSRLSWQQVALALGSMIVGMITSVSISTANGSPWPVIIIWIAIVVINLAIFRAGRPSRRDRRAPH